MNKNELKAGNSFERSSYKFELKKTADAFIIAHGFLGVNEKMEVGMSSELDVGGSPNDLINLYVAITKCLLEHMTNHCGMPEQEVKLAMLGAINYSLDLESMAKRELAKILERQMNEKGGRFN